jgi:hypothetical protein
MRKGNYFVDWKDRIQRRGGNLSYFCVATSPQKNKLSPICSEHPAGKNAAQELTEAKKGQ